MLLGSHEGNIKNLNLDENIDYNDDINDDDDDDDFEEWDWEDQTGG